MDPRAGVGGDGLTMSDASLFDTACSLLEKGSDFDRVVARGTIRLVLKKAGLEPRSVTPQDLSVALQRLLPNELTTRGVAEADALVASITRSIELQKSDAGTNTPEAIFARLGGS